MSSSSNRVLFQRFFPQNNSLLPKIVTEAYANLKKKKTICNTTLKHNIVMQSWSSAPLWSVRVFPFFFCQPEVFFSIYASSKFTWALVHYYIVGIFPRRSIIVWTKTRPGSRTCTSCYKLLPFSNCYMMNLKLQNAAQRAHLCYLKGWGIRFSNVVEFEGLFQPLCYRFAQMYFRNWTKIWNLYSPQVPNWSGS